MFRMNSVGVVASSMFVSAAAIAIPQGAYWVEVPIVDDPGDAEDLTGFRSFDLFVQLEEGDRVVVMTLSDLFSDIAELRLGTGQVFFNHTIGDDMAANPALFGAFPDLVYDTRGQLGESLRDEYTTASTPTDWDPAGVPLGLWNSLVADGAEPNSNNEFWMARITVSSVGSFGEPTAHLGEFLGGSAWLYGDGPNGEFGEFSFDGGQFEVPNAFLIPGPSVASLFGIVGIVGVSRRRR